MALTDGDELLSIPFKVVVIVVAGLPLSALFLCVLLSMILHWDEATRTHCGVLNYFPSVSAAVASYSPERYIWRLFVGLHGTPRIALAFAFRNFLLMSPLRPYSGSQWFNWMCNITCFINVLENVFLLMLTAVSSVEDYYWHKAGFIGFVVCSVSYMYLSTWLYDHSGRRRFSPLGERSHQYKVVCCGAETVLIVLAMYFFYRHNTYCEPLVYSLFALCEYAIVVFNILFHSTAHFDFHAKRLTLQTYSGGSSYEALPMHYEEKRT